MKGHTDLLHRLVIDCQSIVIDWKPRGFAIDHELLQFSYKSLPEILFLDMKKLELSFLRQKIIKVNNLICKYIN